MVEAYRLIKSSANLAYATAGQGVRLKSMPGYPEDSSLPLLQFAPDGRLNFGEYKNNPYLTDYDRMLDADTVYQYPRLLPNEFFYDNLIGVPGGGGSGSVNNGLYIKQSGLPFFFGVPVIPYDRVLVEKFVADGRQISYTVDGKTLVNSKFRYTSTWTGLQIVSYEGKYVYRALTALQMMFVNVQYYVDKSLTTPYPVFNPVPYGKSHEQFFKDILLTSKQSIRLPKLQTALSNVNFLESPVGKMNFWDKLLAASPVIVSTLFSVATLGAGTPALLATAATMGFGYATKDANQRAKIAAEINGYYQGINLSNKKENESKAALLSTSPNGNNPPVESLNKNWLLMGAGLIVFLILMKNKKR